MILIRLILLLGLLAPCSMAAQPGFSRGLGPGTMPAASSLGEPWYASVSGLADSHGWFVCRIDPRTTGEPDQWRLWHIPPRRLARTDGRSHGSPDGSLRPSALLFAPPERLAAWGDKVYLAFKPTAPSLGGQATRAVMSLRTRPIGVGDLWADDPPSGLNPCPAIPSAGRMLGFACVEGTPVALMDENIDPPRNPEAAKLRLVRMEPDGWSDVELPPGLQVEGALAYELVESTGDLLLGVWRRGGRLEILRAGVYRTLGEVLDWNSPIVWSSSMLDVPGEVALGASHGTASLLRAGEGLFVRELESPPAAPEGEKVRVRIYELSLSPTSWNAGSALRRIASVEGLGEEAGVVTLPGLARAVVVWHDRPEKAGQPSKALGVYELSLGTGSPVYVGPAVQTSPISGTDAKLLVIALAGISALTLLFIIRTSATEPELHLPDGLALAEPGRRLFAAGVDALLALCVGASLAGTTPGELLTFEGLLSSQAIWAVGYGLMVGLITGTLTESLSGRTLGKVLAGCLVIDARRADARPPSLGASLVRNTVKWGLPPVAALALLDPAGRHRGEVLSGTAVVILIGPEQDDQDGEAGQGR